MDPWGETKVQKAVGEKFEDNFEVNASIPDFEKLADSEAYLAVLEKKLKAIRSQNNILENLSAYRADCYERLMRDGSDLEPVIGDTDQEKLLKKQE